MIKESLIEVVMFGVGKYIDGIENLLLRNVEILFYIDNDVEKRNKLKNEKRVYSLDEVSDCSFQFVIISAYNYKGIEKQLLQKGYDRNKIIPFFDEDLDFMNYRKIFNIFLSIQNKWKWIFDNYKEQMEYKLDLILNQIENKQELFFKNLIYEIKDQVEKEDIVLPKICTVEETCEKIIHDKASISRYGDGEFQIILGAAKDVYQDDDAQLSERLIQILHSNVEGHIVALADDYGCMSEFCKESKDCIRRYMTKEKRKQHYQYIDMQKQYYNAYISRPYVIYPHDAREQANNRFLHLKKIWNGQSILFVEGEYTRMGVGNDLFSNARFIQRILAPNKNAFSVYEEILEAILEVGKNKLILIALGPTATVLAYDLAKRGYWAVDIGHLDLEYEWFLKGEGHSFIPNKYNNEVPGNTEVEDIFDEDYERSIINRVGINR